MLRAFVQCLFGPLLGFFTLLVVKISFLNGCLLEDSCYLLFDFSVLLLKNSLLAGNDFLQRRLHLPLDLGGIFLVQLLQLGRQLFKGLRHVLFHFLTVFLVKLFLVDDGLV